MVFHIEWLTTGEHNPTIQVWLKLYCLEGVNVVSLPVRDEACLQNLIECRCTPGLCRVRSERHIQLFSIVVCNPLSQFLGKKSQQGMAGTVHICNRWMLPCRIGSPDWNDVLPLQSQEPLMQLVLGAWRENIEVSQFHPGVWKKQFVAQAMFSVLDLWVICAFSLGIFMVYI